MTTKERYEAMGKEMVSALGLENKKVIHFWRAFEEERWIACKFHYECFKRNL